MLDESNPRPEYCSTRQAAALLQVSLGTVQKMVERGELEAWKTHGGHRRIRVRSIWSLLKKRMPQESLARHQAPLSVVIAEDEPITQMLYREQFSSWGLTNNVRIVGNGFEGLMEIGRSTPDLLITDLNMPHLDGYAMLNTLRALPELDDMDIIVITGVESENVAAAGGLPPNTTLIQKPVPFHELRGYLQALTARRLRVK